MLSFDLFPFPFINTERLQLRAIQEIDLDDLYTLRTNASVLKYLNREKDTIEKTTSILTQIINNVKNNDAITWAINIKGDTRLIGTIGLWQVDKFNHKAELGYMTLSDHWGKGYVSEALKPVMDYGFEHMRLHRIEAEVNPENAASIRVLEKHGFVREGYYKEDYYYNGEFLDSARYGIITPLK